MVAAASLFPVHPPAPEDEQRILLHDVPWATYVMLRDSIESAAVRMTYLKGRLEIMRPSRGHEVEKTQIARLLELFCLERDIPFSAMGPPLFAKKRGSADSSRTSAIRAGRTRRSPRSRSR